MISGTDQTSWSRSEDLADHAVLTQFDRAAGGMADGVGGRDGRDWRAPLDVLAESPRPLLGAFRQLEIAPRHVEAAGIAKHDAERLGVGDPERRRADRDDEFDLELISCRARRIGDVSPLCRSAVALLEK